jgi:sugar fermentation stimulation protein A
MLNIQGPGTYVLLMELAEERCLAVGRLGAVRLAPGYYLYVGSALGGLRPRLERHLRQEKRRHWHIDYVLEAARVVEVWYALSTERLECGWARELAATSGLTPTAPRFGASDCACATHLFFATIRPLLEETTLSNDGRHIHTLTVLPPEAG